MSTFKDFYNSLDFLNLILFWGTIIVIILIIIFLILYFSRKNKGSIFDKETEIDSFDDVDIIKKNEPIVETTLSNNYIHDSNISWKETEISDNKDFFEEDDKEEKANIQLNTTNNIEKEKPKVIKEETVRENTQLNIQNNNLEKEKPKEEIIKENIQLDINDNHVKQDKEEMPLFEDFIPRKDDKPKAYQKNVFREMNMRNQTSPIGIVYEKKDNTIEEYHESFEADNNKYLNDVYNSLENATVPDKVELTDYEKRQEEDAVISYNELIKKKDNIQFDPEEDAVISYSELLDRKNRLYNIREEEEDKEFLSELKKFRRDL